MKNTVYTVITVVLLLATLCLPAAAQTWTLDNWYAGPDDDDVAYGNRIHDIEFRDNSQVFFGKYDRLYKWDLNLRRLWWFDFSSQVSHVEVPRSDSSVVIHTVGAWIYIRDANDLSVEASVDTHGWEINALDVNEGGTYLITYVRGGGQGFPPSPHWYKPELVYDIWGGNGWQFVEEDASRISGGDGGIFFERLPLLIDPVHSPPRWYKRSYTLNDGTLVHERIREKITSGTPGDTYISPYWNDLDATAITAQYPAGRRIAALDTQNIIHVWSWAGDHLFTFNQSEGYSAHDDILEFTYNGELLVTAYGRWVRFWDISQQAEDHSFWVDAMDDDESIESLAFSDDGKKMALGSSNGTAYIYEWTGGSAPAAPAQEVEPAQPTALLSNYPNPFNPETWIPYQLSEAAEVTVTIHSSDGKLVRELELGQVPAGVYSDKDRAAYWDGRNATGEPVASGVYFYTLTAGDFKATRKMVIRK